MRSSLPRILEGEERSKFVTAARSPVRLNENGGEVIILFNFIKNEIMKMSMTVRTKLKDMLKEQEDEEFLKIA